VQKSRRSHRKRKETLSSQIIQICRRSHLLQIYISIVLKAAHRPLRLTASADSVWPISNLILVERKQESAALENVQSRVGRSKRWRTFSSLALRVAPTKRQSFSPLGRSWNPHRKLQNTGLLVIVQVSPFGAWRHDIWSSAL